MLGDDRTIGTEGVADGSVLIEEDGVSNELGEMRYCDCGGMNLTIGAVTLHLQPEEVLGLAELSDAAASALEGVEGDLEVEELH